MPEAVQAKLATASVATREAVAHLGVPSALLSTLVEGGALDHELVLTGDLLLVDGRVRIDVGALRRQTSFNANQMRELLGADAPHVSTAALPRDEAVLPKTAAPATRSEPAVAAPQATAETRVLSEAQRESDAELAALTPAVRAEVEAHIEEGERLFDAGDLEGALEAVEEALVLAPRNLGAKDLLDAIHKAYSAAANERAIETMKRRKARARARGLAAQNKAVSGTRVDGGNTEHGGDE